MRTKTTMCVIQVFILDDRNYIPSRFPATWKFNRRPTGVLIFQTFFHILQLDVLKISFVDISSD